MKLLFIIGMQKSGTSLFNRMLMQQDFICNPFLPEGRFFWGDNPPFSPVDAPCGKHYQKHNSLNGHYLDANDFIDSDKQLLIKRIERANISESILMNKNPYNSVRVKWLKAVFPNCRIIAMYRKPVANIYSLLKKYIDQDENGAIPEDGWWGIKPKDWNTMVSQNKVEQCIKQWNAVNSEILKNNDLLDMIVNYDELCKSPAQVVSESVSTFQVDNNLVSEFPNIKNMNNEYKIGSRLLSKNREFRKNKGFDLSDLNEEIEFPPFNNLQIEEIEEKTFDVWGQLLSSNKNFKT